MISGDLKEYTSKEAVVAEISNITISDSFKEPVFLEKNFVHDDLAKSIKIHNNKGHSSSKLTPKGVVIKTIEKNSRISRYT